MSDPTESETPVYFRSCISLSEKLLNAQLRFLFPVLRPNDSLRATLCFVCFPLRSPFSHEERFQSTVVTDDQFLRETRAIHARLS